jgi:DUF4097 and DUF4098 domain-containing protein YvlB
MKLKIMVVLIAIAAAWMIGHRHKSGNASSSDAPSVPALTSGQDEIRRSFKLTAGATVELRGINGSVEIETADSDDAEIRITRTAASRDDLERERIVVEQTPERLSIYGQKGDGSRWDNFNGARVRNEVKLRLPRRIELTTKGINGPVKIGEVNGAVRLEGINGGVELAQSNGFTEATGINGGVSLGLARLTDEGLRVKGVNGRVEIRLANNIDADVSVKGLNGIVSFDMPNVTEQEKTRSSMRARIGAGGAPISVTGVNGGIHITSTSTTGNR